MTLRSVIEDIKVVIVLRILILHPPFYRIPSDERGGGVYVLRQGSQFEKQLCGLDIWRLSRPAGLRRLGKWGRSPCRYLHVLCVAEL